MRIEDLGPEELENLAHKILEVKKSPTISVMPDFFLDRIVSYGSSLESFLTDVKRIAEQGGGSLGFRKQSLIRGGNAANTASALARLGARVKLFLKTSHIGLELLKMLMPIDVDLSRVRSDGELSMTVAIELAHRGRLCNVMISDPGSLAHYGPGELSEEDYIELSRSDYVCIFNWTSNLEGTKLAEEVFRKIKAKGKAKTFMDTADPSQRREEIPELVEKVFKPTLLDALGVNENEARWYASALGCNAEDPLACAEELQRSLGIRVDLHTVEYSATFSSSERSLVPCFKVKTLRVTGAGDAWNAGNIYGWALGLSPRERLILANAVAAYYISSLHGEHPKIDDVARFLEEQARLLR